MEISIPNKALWQLLIPLALLSLSQHSEWQRDAVIFPSNSLTYWSFVNGTNNCWLLCPKYQASSYILCSFSHKWAGTRWNSHAALVIRMQQLKQGGDEVSLCHSNDNLPWNAVQNPFLFISFIYFFLPSPSLSFLLPLFCLISLSFPFSSLVQDRSFLFSCLRAGSVWPTGLGCTEAVFQLAIYSPALTLTFRLWRLSYGLETLSG